MNNMVLYEKDMWIVSSLLIIIDNVIICGASLLIRVQQGILQVRQLKVRVLLPTYWFLIIWAEKPFSKALVISPVLYPHRHPILQVIVAYLWFWFSSCSFRLCESILDSIDLIFFKLFFTKPLTISLTYLCFCLNRTSLQGLNVFSVYLI